MGSRKRLVLASLLSLMMALAFVVGLLPNYTMLNATTASDGDGRVSMVGLLNAVLKVEPAPESAAASAGAAATSIVVSAPVANQEYVVPMTTVSAALVMEAGAVGDAADVIFGIDGDWEANDWALISPPVADAPYTASVDLKSLLTGEGILQSHQIYAFANATTLQQLGRTELTYELASEGLPFSLLPVNGDTDADGNGLPDSLDTIPGGAIWLASYEIEPGVFRQVAVARIDAPEKALGDVTLSPTQFVSVTVPTANLSGELASGESLYVVVSTSSTLPGMLDEVAGETDAGAIAEACAAVLPATMGGLAQGGGFVGVSLLAVGSGGLRELALPAGDNIVLALRGLTQNEKRDFAMKSLETAVAGTDSPVFTWDGTGSWAYDGSVQPVPERNAFVTAVPHASVFAPFESTMNIYSINPNSGPIGAATPANILGNFGYIADLTDVETNNFFAVHFLYTQGGTPYSKPATFAPGAHLAVNADGSQTLPIVSPVFTAPITATVRVYDLAADPELGVYADAGNFAFAEYFTLTTNVSPEGVDGVVTKSPDQTQYAPGSQVTLTASSAASSIYTFDHWEGDATGTTNPITISMDANKTVTAVFREKQPVTFTTVVLPDDAAGSIAVSQAGGQMTKASTQYLEGTTLNLAAMAAAGYRFETWSSNVLDPGSPETEITLNQDETVTATFGLVPRYNLTIGASPNGTVTVDPPQPPGGYLEGDVVTLTATPDTGYEFFEWNGPVANPSSAVTTVVMTGNITVSAEFRSTGPQFTLSVTVQPAGAGFVAPAGGTFPANTPVTLNATGFPGFAFSNWVGEVSDPTSPTTVVVMNKNQAVTAVFIAVPTFDLTVNVEPEEAGSVTVSPPNTGPYNQNTTVNLTALANSGWRFLRWDGEVDDVNSPATSIVMTQDQTVTAVFDRPGGLPIIQSISPNKAWLFGGVRAVIQGSNFEQGASVVLDGMTVTPLLVTDTAIYIVVPPLRDTGEGTEASFLVDVRVTNPTGAPNNSATLTDAFTYSRFETVGDVTTTAFVVEGDGPYYIALGGDPTGAQLNLPPSETSPDMAYGIARVSKNGASVKTNLIDPVAFPEDADPVTGKIGNIWEFAIHLYNNTFPLAALNNTAPLGTALYPEIKDWAYPKDDANVTPASLTFPVADTTPALKTGDVRSGLTLWSIDTSFDYGTGATVVDNTPTLKLDYQSQILNDESSPETTETNAQNLETVVARIYDFSAFSLRAALPNYPASVKAGIAVENPDGAKGPFSGGTPVTILAPNGGLARVQVGVGIDVADNAPLSSLVAATVNNPGTDEFLVDLTMPAFPKPTDTKVLTQPVDIAIYLVPNADKPLVILHDAFVYERDDIGCDFWKYLPLILGLGAALLGLAAGGDSGGGGGPCFIATAAYGTPMAADVDTLRTFRDAYLLNNAAGTAFVDTYYRVSPFVADLIARSPFLMMVVRVALIPVIAAVKIPAFTFGLIGLFGMLAYFKRLVKRTRTE